MEGISYSDSQSPKSKTSKRLIFFGLFFLIIVALLGTLAYFIVNGGSQNKAIKTITLKENPSPTVTSSNTPSPTPAETIDRTKINVSIQNGSGLAGVAGKASDILKKLGYNIVSTANADNFNYKNVTIKVKPSKKEILPLLQKDLSSDYSIGSSSADLSTNAGYDVLVIVGK